VNLGRAKTALIYAFLGLNLFLGYHLVTPYLDTLTQTAISAADLESTQSQLESNNYFLHADINRSIQSSSFLTVSTSQQVLDDVLSLFSKGSVMVENDTFTYQLTDRVLTVYPGGQMRVDFKPGLLLGQQSSTLGERELPQLLQQTLRDNFILPEHVRYDYIERESENRQTVYFFQHLEDTPLYAGYLRVTLAYDFVISIELYWLELIERPEEGEMEVIPATEALIKLIEELGPSSKPRNIIKVELGYYSRGYDAEKWDIPPVWRILLEDGDVYYVNAFTGNLEADR